MSEVRCRCGVPGAHPPRITVVVPQPQPQVSSTSSSWLDDTDARKRDDPKFAEACQENFETQMRRPNEANIPQVASDPKQQYHIQLTDPRGRAMAGMTFCAIDEVDAMSTFSTMCDESTCDYVDHFSIPAALRRSPPGRPKPKAVARLIRTSDPGEPISPKNWYRSPDHGRPVETDDGEMVYVRSDSPPQDFKVLSGIDELRQQIAKIAEYMTNADRCIVHDIIVRKAIMLCETLYKHEGRNFTGLLNAAYDEVNV